MPEFVHGKVSYMQIPASDPEQLGGFYQKVFGWSLRGSGGHVSFSDASDELIGAFVTDLQSVGEPGLLPYISVDDIHQGVAAIEAHGGEMVKRPYREPADAEDGLWVATFRDPAGNVMGIWSSPPGS
ncbi:MAG TPA: VOC family protein [Actinomycetota bacterium]|nr:VOC family protein [Actinomycetota bacterium]